MTCYHPLDAWRLDGVSKLSFNPMHRHIGMPVQVPCGQCVGCRLERSRQWAMRCVHEASLYEDNCFITLTYDDEHLPYDRSLDIRHFQLFMKRLRKACVPKNPFDKKIDPDRWLEHKLKYGIRVFYCGEYGDLSRRPHFHAILFNKDFWDKRLWKMTSQGHPVFYSEELSRYWQQGFCLLGAVTFQSAAYVSRYIMKKVTGALATEHYQWIHPETGEVMVLNPEFVQMSRDTGIGKRWYVKWKKDAYPSDTIICNGVKMLPPKAYDRWHAEVDPLEMEQIKFAREDKAEVHAENNTPERLAVREKVKLAQISQLRRSV